MRSSIFIVTVAALATLAAPSASSACSIASDYADPPDDEKPFDPGMAPSPPKVVSATVSHSYADDPGCGGVSSCGDIHGLSLEIRVAPTSDQPLLRIIHDDDSAVYARGFVATDGTVRLFLPGYADVYDPMELEVAVIDVEGYPSQNVPATAYPESTGEGCTAMKGAPSGGGIAVWTLLGIVLLCRRTSRSSHR